MNAQVISRSFSSLLRVYGLETRSELLRMWRMPAFVFPTLLFPAMFYLFFGVLLARGQGGAQQSLYALAGLGSFGVISPGLFGFGVGFALDRGLGWLQLKRATPMPPSAYLLAKVAMAMLFSFIVVMMLFCMAGFLAHVALERSQWLTLLVTLVLSSVPFCAMGLAIGAWSKPQSAPAVVNLIFLPMSFLSGLWMPLQFLPPFMQKLATIFPAYHLGQLAYAAVGIQSTDVLTHVGVLAGFTVIFLLVAARGYRQNPPSNG